MAKKIHPNKVSVCIEWSDGIHTGMQKHSMNETDTRQDVSYNTGNMLTSAIEFLPDPFLVLAHCLDMLEIETDELTENLVESARKLLKDHDEDNQ